MDGFGPPGPHDDFQMSRFVATERVVACQNGTAISHIFMYNSVGNTYILCSDICAYSYDSIYIVYIYICIVYMYICVCDIYIYVCIHIIYILYRYRYRYKDTCVCVSFRPSKSRCQVDGNVDLEQVLSTWTKALTGMSALAVDDEA